MLYVKCKMLNVILSILNELSSSFILILIGKEQN